MVEILTEEIYMDMDEVYQDFCDNASDMMQSVTAEARFRYVNNAWLKTLGYKKQEITSMTLFDIIHPDELEHCRELFRRVMSGENIGLVNTTFVTKGGAKVFVEGNVSCEIVDGKPTYTRGIFRDITERKQAQEALQESKEKFHSLINSIDDLIFVIGMDGTFKDYYQPSNREDLYVPPSEFIGKHFKDVLPPDVTESLQAAIKAVETSVESQKFDYVLEIKGGKLWYEAKISPVRDRSGIITAVTAVSRNITERKRIEHNINERVKELTCLHGVTEIAERPDFTLDELCQEVVNLLPASWQYPEITCARITINGRKFETDNYRETEWKQSSDIRVYGAKAGTVEISYLEDRPEIDEGSFLKEERALLDTVCRQLGRIIENKRMEEDIRHLAYFDEITGLPNRALFNDRLKVALARAKRNKEKLAVMMLDLDQFKIVNDTLGHEAGDQLLQAVGNRLKGALRESDTVSRMGGDEFMVLLPSIAYEKSLTDIAQKILCSFREPFRVRDHELHVTTSIGISLYPKDGTGSDTLIKNADAAMYRSKAKGGNTSQQFDLNTSY